MRDRRLVSRRVFDDELVLIASTHHRFAQQTHVRLAQMRDETLFVYPPKEESGPLQHVLLPAGAVPARVEEVQLTEAITELVKSGLGVAILARWAVQPLIDAGSVVGRALPARGMHRVWSAVMPKDLAGADYVNEFIDLLERHAPTSRSGKPSPEVVSGFPPPLRPGSSELRRGRAQAPGAKAGSLTERDAQLPQRGAGGPLRVAPRASGSWKADFSCRSAKTVPR